MGERLLGFSEILMFGRIVEDIEIKTAKSKPGHAQGENKGLADQLKEQTDPEKVQYLARIYAFAYDGTYYELPSPALFLVHGPGKSATDGNLPYGASNPAPGAGQHDTRQASRAPLGPDVSGVASASFQMANDILYWVYDKLHPTIRMDVTSGMLEHILLDAYMDDDAALVSGVKASGVKASGVKASGVKASGVKASGVKVSGVKARGPSD